MLTGGLVLCNRIYREQYVMRLVRGISETAEVNPFHLMLNVNAP